MQPRPGAPGQLEVGVLPRRSGGGRLSSVGSMLWGGGRPPVRASDQPPAALMDRPMMGPAHQDQVVQIGRAAIQPMLEMVGLAPGQRAVTAGEDTAAVAHGQGGPLGGLDDPGGPADVQGLAGGPTQDRGQPPGRGPELVGQACLVVGVVGPLPSGWSRPWWPPRSSWPWLPRSWWPLEVA